MKRYLLENRDKIRKIGRQSSISLKKIFSRSVFDIRRDGKLNASRYKMTTLKTIREPILSGDLYIYWLKVGYFSYGPRIYTQNILKFLSVFSYGYTVYLLSLLFSDHNFECLA